MDKCPLLISFDSYAVVGYSLFVTAVMPCSASCKNNEVLVIWQLTTVFAIKSLLRGGERWILFCADGVNCVD